MSEKILVAELRRAVGELDMGAWTASEVAGMTPRLAEAERTGLQLAQGRAELGDILMRAADAFERADTATLQESMGLPPGWMEILPAIGTVATYEPEITATIPLPGSRTLGTAPIFTPFIPPTIYRTMEYLGKFSQEQPFGSNDCGPTAQAVVVSIHLHEAGYPGTLDAASYASYLQSRSGLVGYPRYRLTEFTEKLYHRFIEKTKTSSIVGATPPEGMEHAFNDLSKILINQGFPNIGEAEYSNHGTKADLIDNVASGYLTSIMLVWDQDQGAHWINIVGYDSQQDEFYVLDPGNPVNTQDPSQNVTTISWADLQPDWERELEPLRYKQAMVTYRPDNPVTVVTVYPQVSPGPSPAPPLQRPHEPN